MKKIQIAWAYVLAVHVIALLFMSVQRIVLLLCNLEYIDAVEHKASWVSSALLRGLWFDNVIASYITVLPLLLLTVLALCNKMSKMLLTSFNVFYILLYTLVFAIGIGDIPYFKYFFKHLNASIFNWNAEGATNAGMLLQETSYYIYFLFFILSIFSFGFLLFRFSRYLLSKPHVKLRLKDYFLYVPLSLLLMVFCLVGIRGRMGYNPIKTSQAYFCTNSFLNQLGINPSFYFMRDVIELSKQHYTISQLISERDAITFVRQQLGLSGAFEGSPLYREVQAQGPVKEMNVVVILMESMSSDLLGVKQNGKEIAPFLNQLINKSYYFPNFYSAGIHTNHGILATLYGLPSLLDRNRMKNVNIPLCQGMPLVLQEQGYETLFFMTHEAQYDNLNGFLLENGIQEIYAEENYPASKKANSFGVADDYLFEYAVNKLNEKAKQGKPFCATMLTISNHPPYIVPDKFKAVSSDPQYQIVAFADDAIRQFMTKAQLQPWYANTIFVLLGDHGKMVGTQTYEMPLSYNHIPLIIYSPSFADAPQRFAQLGGQVDIFPTVMGLLNRSYVNNTLGIDLFKEQRPYMFFSSDDAVGCIGKEWFYSYNVKQEMEGLYHYKTNSTQDKLKLHTAIADSMRNYSAAMLQTANYLFESKLTRKSER